MNLSAGRSLVREGRLPSAPLDTLSPPATEAVRAWAARAVPAAAAEGAAGGAAGGAAPPTPALLSPDTPASAPPQLAPSADLVSPPTAELRETSGDNQRTEARLLVPFPPPAALLSPASSLQLGDVRSPDSELRRQSADREPQT